MYDKAVTARQKWNYKWCSVKGYPHEKKSALIPTSYHGHERNNSRWMADLNVKGKTMKLLKENREHLSDLRVGEDFLKRTNGVSGNGKFWNIKLS